mmetsp:Transcript_87359/g.136720  ORF Transcript_87359/g.136720 Transcript_87359/m.136720 type:complete len:531 (-) Transcript_87359:63-1655(-)
MVTAAIGESSQVQPSQLPTEFHNIADGESRGEWRSFTAPQCGGVSPSLLRPCALQGADESVLTSLQMASSDIDMSKEISWFLENVDAFNAECAILFNSGAKPRTSSREDVSAAAGIFANECLPGEELHLITQRLIFRLGCRDPVALARIGEIFSLTVASYRSDGGIGAVEFRGYVAALLTQALREIEQRPPQASDPLQDQDFEEQQRLHVRVQQEVTSSEDVEDCRGPQGLRGALASAGAGFAVLAAGLKATADVPRLNSDQNDPQMLLSRDANLARREEVPAYIDQVVENMGNASAEVVQTTTWRERLTSVQQSLLSGLDALADKCDAVFAPGEEVDTPACDLPVGGTVTNLQQTPPDRQMNPHMCRPAPEVLVGTTPDSFEGVAFRAARSGGLTVPPQMQRHQPPQQPRPPSLEIEAKRAIRSNGLAVYCFEAQTWVPKRALLSGDRRTLFFLEAEGVPQLEECASFRLADMRQITRRSAPGRHLLSLHFEEGTVLLRFSYPEFLSATIAAILADGRRIPLVEGRWDD